MQQRFSAKGLHFSAFISLCISGHKRVVELLLERGARTSMVNGVNKTAAQLGAFVGIG